MSLSVIHARRAETALLAARSARAIVDFDFMRSHDKRRRQRLTDLCAVLHRLMRQDVVAALARQRPTIHTLTCRRLHGFAVDRDRHRRVRIARPQVAVRDVLGMVGLDRPLPSAGIDHHLVARRGRHDRHPLYRKCGRQRLTNLFTTLNRLMRQDVVPALARQRPTIHALARRRRHDIAIDRDRHRRVRIARPQVTIGDVFRMIGLDWPLPRARIDNHLAACGGRHDSHPLYRRKTRQKRDTTDYQFLNHRNYFSRFFSVSSASKSGNHCHCCSWTNYFRYVCQNSQGM